MRSTVPNRLNGSLGGYLMKMQMVSILMPANGGDRRGLSIGVQFVAWVVASACGGSGGSQDASPPNGDQEASEVFDLKQHDGAAPADVGECREPAGRCRCASGAPFYLENEWQLVSALPPSVVGGNQGGSLSVVALGDGTAAAIWLEAHADGVSEAKVVWVDPHGDELGVSSSLPGVPFGLQDAPRPLLLRNGNVMLGWSDPEDGQPRVMLADKQLVPIGEAIPFGGGELLQDQSPPALANCEDGSVAVVWSTSEWAAPSASWIHWAKLTDGGAVAVGPEGTHGFNDYYGLLGDVSELVRVRKMAIECAVDAIHIISATYIAVADPLVVVLGGFIVEHSRLSEGDAHYDYDPLTLVCPTQFFYGAGLYSAFLHQGKHGWLYGFSQCTNDSFDPSYMTLWHELRAFTGSFSKDDTEIVADVLPDSAYGGRVGTGLAVAPTHEGIAYAFGSAKDIYATYGKETVLKVGRWEPDGLAVPAAVFAEYSGAPVREIQLAWLDEERLVAAWLVADEESPGQNGVSVALLHVCDE